MERGDLCSMLLYVTLVSSFNLNYFSPFAEVLLKDNSLPSFDSVRKIDDANKQTMVLIISHFQNLFDVDEVS